MSQNGWAGSRVLAEVRWTPFADSQYQALTRRYPRARAAIDGTLRTIGVAGRHLPVAPGAGGLRTVETRRLAGIPHLVLIFSEDEEGVFWVEEIRLLQGPTA